MTSRSTGGRGEGRVAQHMTWITRAAVAALLLVTTVATGADTARARTGGGAHRVPARVHGYPGTAFSSLDWGRPVGSRLRAAVEPATRVGEPLAGADDAVDSWGDNRTGQLGDGTTDGRLNPAGIASTAGVPGIAPPATVYPISISASRFGGLGDSFSLAVGADGEVYAWGANDNGQLGDGTHAERHQPVAVALPGGVRAVAAGLFHGLAVGSDGRAYAWGDNRTDQLGNGTTTGRAVPAAVALPGGVRATAVSAGDWHSLALGADGEVYAWGVNDNGQLGDGTHVARNRPVAVALPGGVRATAVSAGGEHSLALGSDGNVYAWGFNHFGQLGDGTTDDRDSPAAVALPGGVRATAVSAGDAHSLALGSDRKAYAWGDNSDGELGDGTTDERHSPVAVAVPAGITVLAVSAGSGHSLAIVNDPGPLRYDGIWTPGNDGRPVLYGYTLADFRAQNAVLFGQGYRLSQVESYPSDDGSLRYNGIWTPASDGRPVVYGWTLADLRAKNRQLYAQGFRLSDLQAYTAADGTVRYNGIWTPGNDGRPVVYNVTLQDLRADNGTFYNQGFRLARVQAFTAPDGSLRYNGIWTPGNDGRPVVYGYALADLQARNAQLYAQGFRLAQVQGYMLPGGGGVRYNAIWTPGSDGRPVLFGYALHDFRAQNGTYDGQGYRLTCIDTWHV